MKLLTQYKTKILLCAALLLGLQACVTTTTSVFKKDDTAAAAYNVQLCIDYMRQNNLSEAKDKIDKALEQDPKSADAHFVAGILYDRINENRKADEFYSKAISIDSKNADYLNGYAAFLCRKGNRQRGEKMALKAADDPLYKTPQDALLNAGNCALDDGRPLKAEEHFRRALKFQPNFPPVLMQMSELEFRSKNYLPARAFLERYQQYAPATAQSLWLGVRIERALGNMSAAEIYARRLKRDFATSDEAKALLELENNKS